MPGRFSIYPFVSAGLELRQLDSFSYASNERKAEIIPGGAVDRLHVATGYAEPTFNLVTRDLMQAFGVLTPSSILRTTNGIAYVQKRADGGTFNASNVHRSYTMAKLDIVPRTLVASQNDTDGAVLTVDVHALFDGTNEPVALAENVTLPALSAPIFNSRYFMGPVYYGPSLGRTLLDNVERVEIDFGIGYSKKGFNGSAFPTEGSVITREPIIKVTSTDLLAERLKNIISRGCEDDSGSGLRIYFQRGAGCDDRVAAATADHLRITAPFYEWTTESINIQGNDDGTVTYTFRPRGTSVVNGAMTVALSQAITN
jgi:hypothetical protein